jgi:hypothetical protein
MNAEKTLLFDGRSIGCAFGRVNGTIAASSRLIWPCLGGRVLIFNAEYCEKRVKNGAGDGIRKQSHACVVKVSRRLADFYRTSMETILPTNSCPNRLTCHRLSPFTCESPAIRSRDAVRTGHCEHPQGAAISWKRRSPRFARDDVVYRRFGIFSQVRYRFISLSRFEGEY